MKNSEGYNHVHLSKNCKGKILSVHRLVAKSFIKNPEEKPYVDHIDNVKSNNKVNNLRWCTPQENRYNMSAQVNNTSGTKGVYWHCHSKKWTALIKNNGKLIHLGSFVNIEDAKMARMKKANELFGEFVNDCEKLPKIKLKSTVKLFKTIDDLLNEINQLIHL